MKQKAKLTASMSLAEFDNGYWYAVDLKRFATAAGIPSANAMRKDQLEAAIKRMLATGKTGKVKRAPAPSSSRSKVRDVERGLKLSLPVAVYTNDRTTKDFLEREAAKMAPGYKRKSGARYRINRWRDAQLASGAKITYRDLIAEYVRLSQTDGPFEQIPHGRYVNFVSNYHSAEPGASRAQVLKAWNALKRLDIPKNYRSWAKWMSTQRRRG